MWSKTRLLLSILYGLEEKYWDSWEWKEDDQKNLLAKQSPTPPSAATTKNADVAVIMAWIGPHDLVTNKCIGEVIKEQLARLSAWGKTASNLAKAITNWTPSVGNDCRTYTEHKRVNLVRSLRWHHQFAADWPYEIILFYLLPQIVDRGEHKLEYSSGNRGGQHEASYSVE